MHLYGGRVPGSRRGRAIDMSGERRAAGYVQVPGRAMWSS
jgi:hypothetical protein